jgi:hypothetical protein
MQVFLLSDPQFCNFLSVGFIFAGRYSRSTDWIIFRNLSNSSFTGLMRIWQFYTDVFALLTATCLFQKLISCIPYFYSLSFSTWFNLCSTVVSFFQLYAVNSLFSCCLSSIFIGTYDSLYRLVWLVSIPWNTYKLAAISIFVNCSCWDAWPYQL